MCTFELNYDFMHMYYWKFDLFFKYVTPLLLFFSRHFFRFRLKTLLSIRCRIYSLDVSYISQNYCQIQIIVFPVKFHGFPNKVDWWGGTIWAKCPKTARKLQNRRFQVKTEGDMWGTNQFSGQWGRSNPVSQHPLPPSPLRPPPSTHTHQRKA